ncbi:MAG: ChaB family protein [Thermoplasmatota archaeon]
MTVRPQALPKEAKALPPAAQELWVTAYNADFGWRSSESHAEKEAWRAVRARYHERDGAWVAT